jgi:hypothetical protein
MTAAAGQHHWIYDVARDEEWRPYTGDLGVAPDAENDLWKALHGAGWYLVWSAEIARDRPSVSLYVDGEKDETLVAVETDFTLVVVCRSMGSALNILSQVKVLGEWALMERLSGLVGWSGTTGAEHLRVWTGPYDDASERS